MIFATKKVTFWLRPFDASIVAKRWGRGPSPRYDIFPAQDLGIVNKVFVNRGHEPRPDHAWSFAEIRDINGLPALVGL